MKKLLLTATFLVAGAFSMLGQGLLDFSNAPWETWPDSIDRLVYKADGVTPVDDPTWSAQLVQLVGGNWTKIGQPSNFYGPGGEGIWSAQQLTATVNTLAVEIYDGAGTLLKRSDSFSYTKANSVPPSTADTLMVNFRAFAVPEPSTIALGVLGLGALLLFRRRK